VWLLIKLVDKVAKTSYNINFNNAIGAEMNYTQEQINSIVAEAQHEAAKAAREFHAKHGDRDCCGFAWTNIYGVKGNTKLGKMLKAAGVRQDYTKAFQLWNPSKFPTQSLNILEAGADAAASVFKRYGFEAYAGSRMD
jgi:hypothetical protein